MNVSLTPQLEAMIRQRVESGRYNNASEVVREALRLLEEQERSGILKPSRTAGTVPPALCFGLLQIPRSPGQFEKLTLSAVESSRR